MRRSGKEGSDVVAKREMQWKWIIHDKMHRRFRLDVTNHPKTTREFTVTIEVWVMVSMR